MGEGHNTGTIVYSLRRYGAPLFGYHEKPHRIPPEKLVVDILKNYLRAEPRFVEALCTVVSQDDFDFAKLHSEALKAGQCHTVHWLLLELEEAFQQTGMEEKASAVHNALPLFKKYSRSLEEALVHETPYRRNKVREFASPAARRCGVPVVYYQADFQKKVRLYCGENQLQLTH